MSISSSDGRSLPDIVLYGEGGGATPRRTADTTSKSSEPPWN